MIEREYAVRHGELGKYELSEMEFEKPIREPNFLFFQQVYRHWRHFLFATQIGEQSIKMDNGVVGKIEDT